MVCDFTLDCFVLLTFVRTSTTAESPTKLFADKLAFTTSEVTFTLNVIKIVTMTQVRRMEGKRG